LRPSLQEACPQLGNRVRIGGQWHDLERKLPWYRMAVDELDFVHACVRKLIGERQFATAPTGRGERIDAGVVRHRAGAAHLRIAA
jgi:hypothetical protein